MIVKLKYSFIIVSYKKTNKLRLNFSIVIENHIRNPKSESSIISDNNEEKWYIVASQVFLPFMIAGFGMVAAGLVLERVKVDFIISNIFFDEIIYI
jgi:hypothetical protein